MVDITNSEHKWLLVFRLPLTRQHCAEWQCISLYIPITLQKLPLLRPALSLTHLGKLGIARLRLVSLRQLSNRDRYIL